MPRQCDFWSPLIWARAWLGWPDDDGNVPDAAGRCGRSRRQSTRPPIDDAADAERRAEIARRFWHDSEPVRGTVGERYLIEVRKIPVPSHGWPGQVRFHRDTRSLILAATTADGTVRAVQMVRLTPSARVVQREDGGKLKIYARCARRRRRASARSRRRTAVVGRGAGDRPVSLACHRARNLDRSRQHVAPVDPPLTAQVIVCADDDLLNHPDPRKTAAARALAKAVQAWRAAVSVLP